MRTFSSYIILLIGLVLLPGCESLEVVVPIDVDEEDPVLAIGAYFSNEMETYTLAVARAVSALSDLETTIQDSADIVLFEDGILFHDYLYEVGEQEEFTETFEVGKVYRLEVSKEGFEPVYSESIFPSLVSIDTAYLKGNAIVGEFSEEVKQVRLNFSDTSGQDFYEIRMYAKYETPSGEFQTLVYPSTEQSTGLTSAWEGIFLSDNNFDGQEADLILNYYDIDVENEAEIIVELRHITEAYYLYQLSVELAVNSNENPFSEPVQVKSNIENGFGVFALFNNDFFRLDL
jgi:hypothetical protein